MTICPKYWIDLTRLDLRLDVGKCYFKRESVKNLGYRIDAQGLHPLEEKVQALVSAPQNVTELKPFLGMVQYNQKPLPKSRNDTSATISAATESNSLGMDEKGRSCFPKVQVPLGLLSTTGHTTIPTIRFTWPVTPRHME